jgi:mono/diheme cytochrome c family protein
MTKSRFYLRPRELALFAAVLVALFGLIQLLPVGAPRSNPPVVAEPAWDSPQTRQLFARACGDCHSNSTVWPWYGRVAPASWLVAHDVAEGRERLNVSEWQRPQKDAPKAAREVREGDMPLPSYLWLHSEARLSETERQALVAGLVATFGEKRVAEMKAGD